MIYAVGATALYSISPDTGEVGQSIGGFKVTGVGLAELITNFHSPVIGQNPFALQNAVSTTNSIQGTLSIARDAFIGQWSVGLRNRNPLRQHPNVYNAPFNVTHNGVSVRTLSLSRLRRGDSGVAFTITGDNLGAVSGVEILNPDGSKDTGIVASNLVAKDTSIQGSLSADGGVPIGPRFIILDFSDGTSVKTLLNFAVQTPEGLFLTFPNIISSPPNTNGVPMTIQESVPWGITGIKFLRNGVNDSSIKVRGFTSSNGTTSVTLDIARNAALGIRNIVLIGPDGSDIPTSAIFAIVPFTQ